ncbi:MAG TPA: hypothetical protein VHZ76_04505, partial [Gammaproteobacteria bacterium]|nr:hypothetical protein [Gammaproteobacteria bacterium]
MLRTTRRLFSSLAPSKVSEEKLTVPQSRFFLPNNNQFPHIEFSLYQNSPAVKVPLNKIRGSDGYIVLLAKNINKLKLERSGHEITNEFYEVKGKFALFLKLSGKRTSSPSLTIEEQQRIKKLINDTDQEFHENQLKQKNTKQKTERAGIVDTVAPIASDAQLSNSVNRESKRIPFLDKQVKSYSTTKDAAIQAARLTKLDKIILNADKYTASGEIMFLLDGLRTTDVYLKKLNAFLGEKGYTISKINQDRRYVLIMMPKPMNKEFSAEAENASKARLVKHIETADNQFLAEIKEEEKKSSELEEIRRDKPQIIGCRRRFFSLPLEQLGQLKSFTTQANQVSTGHAKLSHQQDGKQVTANLSGDKTDPAYVHA